jgi:hypothetical protein
MTNLNTIQGSQLLFERLRLQAHLQGMQQRLGFDEAIKILALAVELEFQGEEKRQPHREQDFDSDRYASY